MTTVDTHLHLWDLDAGDVAWLRPEHGPLHRSFGPDEAAQVLRSAGVQTAVLVQAADSIAHTWWLLDLAAAHEWVHGVVGWIPLDRPDTLDGVLDRLATHPGGAALRGVRHLVHDDPRADFLDLPTVRAGLSLLARRGLPFDVPDAWPAHLAAVGRLAGDLPELTIVLDHLGKPPRGTDEMAAWEKRFREIAGWPNVVAKYSGLQCPGQPFTPGALRPLLHLALDVFGADRLMLGSDWPMTLREGGYARVAAVTADLLDELDDTTADALRGTTATRVYGPARKEVIA